MDFKQPNPRATTLDAQSVKISSFMGPSRLTPQVCVWAPFVSLCFIPHRSHMTKIAAPKTASDPGPKRVVLAYSGGLDTSIILKWLQDAYL